MSGLRDGWILGSTKKQLVRLSKPWGRAFEGYLGELEAENRVPATIEEPFERGYELGRLHQDRACFRPECHIESAHQHPKTRAEVDGDYARGVRAALALVDGRGFVSRKSIRNAITALLSQEVQP